jgi:hypothetical protein
MIALTENRDIPGAMVAVLWDISREKVRELVELERLS